MKKVFLPFLIIGLSFSNEICFDLQDINNTKVLKVYSKLFPSFVPEKILLKDLKRKIFFAKKYNLKDKDLVAKVGAIEALSKAYRNYLIKKYSPNDKVIKSFYEEYKNQFAPSTIVNISTIKVKSIDLADKIYKELKNNPKEFNKLAKKYSLDRNINYVNIPLDNFNLKIRDFIRKAKKGDISEPVKIGEFYYIDRLDNKKIIQPTYKNLKPQLKKLLVNIYVNKLMKRMYEEQK